MCKATLLQTLDERENLGEFMVSTFSLAIHWSWLHRKWHKYRNPWFCLGSLRKMIYTCLAVHILKGGTNLVIAVFMPKKWSQKDGYANCGPISSPQNDFVVDVSMGIKHERQNINHTSKGIENWLGMIKLELYDKHNNQNRNGSVNSYWTRN